MPFVSEYVVALNLLHLRRESEGRALAQWASLDHRPGDPAEYERALKCPLRVNATWNGFAFSPEVWKVPMRRSDPTLIRLLEPHADAAVGGASSPETMRARVRREMAERHLNDSALAIGEISFLLGYSEPTAFHRAFRRWRGLTPQAYRAERRP